MSQIAIYVPEEIQEKMDRLAGEEGKSRSQWVKDAILDKLATRHLTDQWFGVWGAWEDSRSTGEILRDIDSGAPEKEREPLK